MVSCELINACLPFVANFDVVTYAIDTTLPSSLRSPQASQVPLWEEF